MSSSRPFRLALGPPSRGNASARWFWLAALLLPAAAAQEAPPAGDSTAPPPPVSAPATADDPDDDSTLDAAGSDHRELPARRLLHGAGGGVLRESSRWAVDHWDVQRKGQWEQLPPGAIDRVRLESDVLAEAGRRQAAVRRGSPAQRVGVAAWMLDEGLLVESLKLLDDVLAADPDQPEALALLSRDDLPFGLPRLDVPEPDLPAARARFLQFAAELPPALREVAVHQLVRLDARLASQPDQSAALREELQRLLAGRSAGGRALGALALRRVLPRGAAAQPEVEELLRRAVLDVAPDVRRNASLALRDNGEPAVILPAVAALASTSRAVRTNAAESLGLMGYQAAVAPLADRLVTLPSGGGEFHPRANVFVGSQIAYVAGFNVHVANQAAIGDPEIGVLQEGASLDVTVLGASTSGSASSATEIRALTTALQRLTGAHPGDTRSAWVAWWGANRQEWMGGARP